MAMYHLFYNLAVLNLPIMKYDVFISCKSEDYKYAEEIYQFLTDKGIHTFLASKELRNIGDTEYRRAISTAMKSAYHMIVFASKAEYIDSTWVYYEWDMFVNAMLKGFKKGQIMTILKGVNTDDINMDLWKYESFTFENYKENLIDYVETPSFLRRKERRECISIFKSKSQKQKPIMNVVLLLDHSGSMAGERIECVNSAFSEIFEHFELMNPDIDVRMNVILFSTRAVWMYDKMVNIEGFKWRSIEAEGLTSLGEALRMLNESLNRNGLFCSENGETFFGSLLMLISDGEPTDDYKEQLRALVQNPFYKKSKRFAIGIGEDVRPEVLEEFTGNQKTTFNIPSHELEMLSPLVKRLLTMNLYALSAASLEE